MLQNNLEAKEMMKGKTGKLLLNDKDSSEEEMDRKLMEKFQKKKMEPKPDKNMIQLKSLSKDFKDFINRDSARTDDKINTARGFNDKQSLFTSQRTDRSNLDKEQESRNQI